MGKSTIFLIFLCCICDVQALEDVAPAPTLLNLPELGILKRWRNHIEWKSTHQLEIKKYEKLMSDAEKLLILDAEVEHKLQAGNVSKCVTSLMLLGIDLVSRRRKYALQALDSAGKPGSGIMLGNIRWSGSYFECKNIKMDYYKGKWCQATLGPHIEVLNQAPMGMSVGLCVPDSCSSDYLNERLQLISNISGSVTVQCPEQLTEWTMEDIISLFVFGVLLTLVILGTVIEMFLSCKKKKTGEKLSISSDGLYKSFQSPFNKDDHPVWMKVILCFSIIKNTKSLLDTERKEGTIDVLHGMRFLSITWVVLGHTYIMVLLYTQNAFDMFNWMTHSFTFEMVVNATFCVDTFFFIGGLLVAYLYLKDAAAQGGILKIPMIYLRRYIRITPPYAFIILFTVGFYGKLADGPMWPFSYEGDKNACIKYWWTNLLYINNLHPASVGDQCFTLGWYLANDMQFFLLAPISILLLSWKPKIGINILIFGIISNLIVTGVISFHYKEQPQPVVASLLLKLFDNGANSMNNSKLQPKNNLGMVPSDATETFWGDLYFRPWTRIGVYLIGMMTGYILHTTKSKIKMNKLFVFFGWVIAASINLVVLYGLWYFVREGQPMEVSLAAFYNTMSRPMWAVGLSWLVLACCSGYGGPVNAFLSWKFFIPLSRLTFGIFLTHPMVLFWWFASLEENIYYSNKQFAFFFTAILVVSIAAAYVLTMLTESPAMSLQKMMFSCRKEKMVEIEPSEEPIIEDWQKSDK